LQAPSVGKRQNAERESTGAARRVSICRASPLPVSLVP